MRESRRFGKTYEKPPVRNEPPKEKTPFEQKVERMRSEQKPLSTGIQKDVYEEPGHETSRVRKVYRPFPEPLPRALEGVVENPTELSQKMQFFVIKILHFLFPDNIPNRYKLTSEPFTVSDQRIDGKPISVAFRFFGDAR